MECRRPYRTLYRLQPDSWDRRCERVERHRRRYLIYRLYDPVNMKLDGISMTTSMIRRSGRPYHHSTSQDGVGGQKGSGFVREIAIRGMPTEKRRLTPMRRIILMTKMYENTMRMCMSKKCAENHTPALPVTQMIRLTTRIAKIVPKYVAESRKSTTITFEIPYSTPASWTHRIAARTQRVLWNMSEGMR